MESSTKLAGRLGQYKEYRVLVEFDSEQGDDVYCISRGFWNVKLGVDLERGL